jgi:hypothetical protein
MCSVLGFVVNAMPMAVEHYWICQALRVHAACRQGAPQALLLHVVHDGFPVILRQVLLPHQQRMSVTESVLPPASSALSLLQWRC